MSDKIIINPEILTFSCGCGAIGSSVAAFNQMSRRAQEEHLTKIRTCQTCAYDAKSAQPQGRTAVADVSAPRPEGDQPVRTEP